MERARAMVIAIAVAVTGLTVAAEPAVAAPAATAQWSAVPHTWTSPTPAQLVMSWATGVVAFGSQAWVVGNMVHQGSSPPGTAAVQRCTSTGCTQQALPGPTRVEVGGLRITPQVAGITGTSATDLWAYGWFHSAPNTDIPLIWRSNGRQWRQVSTAGIEGDNTVAQIVISPAGEPWARVWADFDSITGAVYRLVGDRWTLVSSVEAPVFPGPCREGAESWYDNHWTDLVFVGGEPVLVGSCASQPMVIKRRGTVWERIDQALPTGVTWSNAAVVNSQLWVQGTAAGGAPVIGRRASGRWETVSTTGLPATARFRDLAGTQASNVWLVGDIRAADGTYRAASWRWTGTAWREVTVPAQPGNPQGMEAVHAVGTAAAWAVGRSAGADPTRSVIVRER